MKIGDSKPVSGISSGSAREREKARSGSGAAAGGRMVSDSATIMGVPEAEMTPAVRDALMKLMGEVAELRREVSGLRERLRESEELADRDPLIPVLNRRAFVRELNRAIAHVRRYSEPAGLVYFDLDNFKQVNDAHGHAAGDAALHHLARIVLENVRESDIVGRLGGDELGLILVRADEATARSKAASLATLVLGRPLRFEEKMIPLSISVGAVSFTGEDEPDDALARADRAMYEAKRGGG
ncbi:MAG: GGDEF domain-containing protein [Parvibaculum sp.]